MKLEQSFVFVFFACSSFRIKSKLDLKKINDENNIEKQLRQPLAVCVTVCPCVRVFVRRSPARRPPARLPAVVCVCVCVRTGGQLHFRISSTRFARSSTNFLRAFMSTKRFALQFEFNHAPRAFIKRVALHFEFQARASRSIPFINKFAFQFELCFSRLSPRISAYRTVLSYSTRAQVHAHKRMALST